MIIMKEILVRGLCCALIALPVEFVAYKWLGWFRGHFWLSFAVIAITGFILQALSVAVEMALL